MPPLYYHAELTVALIVRAEVTLGHEPASLLKSVVLRNVTPVLLPCPTDAVQVWKSTFYPSWRAVLYPPCLANSLYAALVLWRFSLLLLYSNCRRCTIVIHCFGCGLVNDSDTNDTQ